MTEADTERLPFDQADADAARAYLAANGLTALDPFALASPDLIMTTSLADARLMMAESFATANAIGRKFRVFPMLVESASANAFAVDHSGLNVCGIHIGLVSAVYELSLFVFSQSTLFRDIGDAAGERSPRLPPDAMLAFWISDRLRAGEGTDGRAVGAELTPRDGARQTAALFLTLLMLRFVWLHELFHCLNGHTGLLAHDRRKMALHEITDGAALALVEVETSTRTDLPVSEGYCMEFDADRSAFWVTMKRQIDGEEPIDGIRTLPVMTRLRLTAFAAVLMTFLFDQAARRRTAASGGTHPVAWHRLHNLMRTLASNLSDPAGEIKQLFAYTVVEMDYFQGCVPQAVSGSQLIQDLGSAELQLEFDGVEDALAIARSRFAPWAFRRLA
jgi:hypothetical protein